MRTEESRSVYPAGPMILFLMSSVTRMAAVVGFLVGGEGPDLPSASNHLSHFHWSSTQCSTGIVDQVAARVFVSPAMSRGASNFSSCRRRAVVVSSFRAIVSEIRNFRTQASHNRQ